MVQFSSKLTGAKAKLFAAVCEQYSSNAELACNDVLDDTPLFSWLSPYQRVALVREVMVGLLCEKEPLPPSTLQHYATYQALRQTLKIELEAEIGFQYDNCRSGEIGDDLLLDDENEDDQESASRVKKRAKMEHDPQFRLVNEKVKRYKEELVKKGAYEYDRVGPMEDFRDHIYLLFKPSMVPSSTSSTPVRELNGTEQRSFYWRLLCEAALKECLPFSANDVSLNFDFRSDDCDKWYRAIDFLFITLSDITVDKLEHQLVVSAIDSRAYADESQHARIAIVKQLVAELRKQYDSSWNPDLLAADQRVVCALGASPIPFTPVPNTTNQQFFNGLLAKLREPRTISTGLYQGRLNAYNEIRDQYAEGLRTRLGTAHANDMTFWECDKPSSFEPDDDCPSLLTFLADRRMRSLI